MNFCLSMNSLSFIITDTVYFVLPGRKKSLQTVYGVSCYRQMDAKVSVHEIKFIKNLNI